MVEIQSVMSLLIETYVRDERLSTATGFVVTRRRFPYLITNRHVFTGRDNNTGEILSKKTGATPDRVFVWFNATNLQEYPPSLRWQGMFWDLYEDEDQKKPRWLEHRTHGSAMDVVAVSLPRPAVPDVRYRAYDLDAPSYKPPKITEDVQVVGFPFGLASAGNALDGPLALWTRGTIASETEYDFDGLPRFLIDARTRMGQSGSPVLIDRSEVMFSEALGEHIVGGRWADLLGVYSGRINPESDLGIVWRIDAVRDLIDGYLTIKQPDEAAPSEDSGWVPSREPTT